MEFVVIDLGSAPLSNAYLTAEDLKRPERWYPLRVLVCERCWLVQTEDFVAADDSFTANYAYFSGYSTSWLSHVEKYVERMRERFDLGARSHVIEVATNDGSLLQYVKKSGIPCTGIEPTASTAAAARSKGLTVIEDFFGSALARALTSQSKQADLITANNVLAHVPDINDFVAGFALLLKPSGVATFEFPYVAKLVMDSEFDTIYHEHFSYLSLTAVETIFACNGLSIFDVEELSTHGGSLRVFAQRTESGKQPRAAAVDALIENEKSLGMNTRAFYCDFQRKAERIKDDLIQFLIDAKGTDKRVAAYGAAAKGNTLLNYAGIRRDLLPFVVDRNPMKQGKFMPGSRIPIVPESHLQSLRPDFVVVFPWNILDEIREQLSYITTWDAKLVTAVPRLRIGA